MIPPIFTGPGLECDRCKEMVNKLIPVYVLGIGHRLYCTSCVDKRPKKIQEHNNGSYIQA